jgi:UDP-3-O-[3-hydroxymyristoyl] glucosamine N-acyltransferase
VLCGASVHPSVVLGRGCVISQGVSVLSGAVVGNSTIVRPNTTIGAGAHIGQFVYIEAECQIGDGARIADHMHLPRGLVVERGCDSVNGVDTDGDRFPDCMDQCPSDKHEQTGCVPEP